MEFSIVENLSALQESIFSLSRGPQLHFGEKSKKWSKFIKFTDFPPFPLFGVPWAAVILRVFQLPIPPCWARFCSLMSSCQIVQSDRIPQTALSCTVCVLAVLDQSSLDFIL